MEEKQENKSREMRRRKAETKYNKRWKEVKRVRILRKRDEKRKCKKGRKESKGVEKER